jgi:LuxR family maltose regulon positive regulatory protein
LRNYLLERFETLPPDFAREIRARAGTACASAENYFQAAKFFRGAGDYASVISMPFTAKYIYNNFDPSMLDFFERFVKECPGRIIEERPIFLVMIAYLMFRNGKRDSFEEIARIIRRIIDGHNCLSEKEMARFRGEFALLMSFTQFNDIVGMSEYHRQALAFFESLDERPTRSIFFGGSIPWTFGCPSVFFLYWRNPGELGKELEYMEECVPIYSKITGGHGAGGGDVMRAESLLLQGDDAGAEVAAHEAIYLADSENQTGNSLCAELVLARIAILRGDAAGYASVRSGILERARGAHQRAVFLLGELSRAKLDLTLGINDNLPDWLSDINRMSGVLYVHARPYAHALYGKLLLMEGRRAELRALFRMVMGMARGMNLVLPQIYHHIYLAAADTADGNDGDAGEHLSAALGLASPDRIYLPFAEHWQYLESAFKRLETRPGEWDFPAVRALAERQTKGVRAVTALVKKSSAQVLSPREREIAALAAEGLTNPEIAERLFITRGTVKNAVARALEKTGTKSRAELAAWMMKN